jgi:predicted Zn-dependent protease
MSSLRRIVTVAWPLALLVAFGTTFRRVPTAASAAVETIDCSGPLEDGRSVTALERCVALDPTNVELMTDLGAAYEASGRPDKALAIYRRALDADPRDADLHVRLGELLLKNGKRVDARAEADVALRWHPNFANARDLASRASAAEANR